MVADFVHFIPLSSNVAGNGKGRTSAVVRELVLEQLDKVKLAHAARINSEHRIVGVRFFMVLPD